tara:strand:+ start:74 stop:961 length:888 start_codon:yes stop_codon:yes gene_type:complete
MLSALVDKPLIQNPLAGGQLASGPSFRQPGDMGRYVAFNDPGQPGAGFSNYQDYLAAGNKPVPMNLKTLEGVSNANFNVSPPGTLNVTPPSVSVSEQTPLPGIIDPNIEARKKADEEFLKTADEFQRGFRESEFYKPGGPMTTDMAEFIYSSPTKGDITMKGSSSGIGQFGKYLESIGKGDLLRRVGNELSQATGPLQPSPGSLFPFPGMDSTEVASVSPETLGGGINNLPEFGRPPSMFSNTEGIGSLIGFEPIDQTFNSQQAFNQQRFNEYVDSLVNERLKDFFGGIMGAIDV